MFLMPLWVPILIMGSITDSSFKFIVLLIPMVMLTTLISKLNSDKPSTLQHRPIRSQYQPIKRMSQYHMTTLINRKKVELGLDNDHQT